MDKVKNVTLATVAAIVANIVVLIIGKAVFPAPETFGPYTYGAVIFLTAAGMIAAGVAYYLMASFWAKKFPARSARKDYVTLAYVLLVLSFIPDLLMPYSTEPDEMGATWGIVAVLMVMHVVAALIAIRFYAKKAD